MNWLYIAGGTAGGLTAVGIITYRVWAYFHSFAVSADRNDVQLNVLLVFGLGIGILLVPLGVGVGLLVGFFLNRGLDYLHKRRPEALTGGEGSQAGGASWVTRRREQ